MSVMELTIGNWAPVCWVVFEIDPIYGFIALTYVMAINFAMVRVISGVFLHETFAIAATDDDLMIMKKERSTAKHVKKMKSLFLILDKNANSQVDRKEFIRALANPSLKSWLSAMDIEPDDADLLFDFIDDGDGIITPSELITGLARLKGNA